jgi:hypothetical protein
MARIIKLNSHNDDRGSLTIIEKNIPFNIKRVYYMSNVTSKRGGHRHRKTIQALIALNGSCEVFIENKNGSETLLLNSQTRCLILDPEDWHTMDNFSDGTILLVLASEFYDKNDYIEEGY